MFQAEEVKDKLRKLQGGPQTPLTIHLRQEIDRLNIIVQLTTTSLNNLRLAIAGLPYITAHECISAQLDNVSCKLNNNTR